MAAKSVKSPRAKMTKVQRQKIEEALRESELRFREMAESIGDAFWMTDLIKSKTLYVSPAYERIWGRSCESLYRIPTSFLDSIHPDDRQQVKDAFPLQAKGQFDIEYRIVRPDGSLRWIRDRAYPIRDHSGKVYRVAGIAEDISEQKKIEHTVRELDARNRQFLNAIPDLVFVKGEESRILWANKAFCDYYGMSVDELTGIIDSPINKPDYTKKYVRDDAYVWRTGKTLHIPEEPVVRFDGETRLFETLKSPIFDSQGKVSTIIGIARDITERKRRDTELRRLARITSMSADAIVEVDTHQIVSFWNLAAEELFGFRSEEVIGKAIRDFFIPEEEFGFTQSFFNRNQQSAEAIVYGKRVHRLDKKGRKVPVMMTAFPIFDEAGNFTGRAAIFSDLTRVIEMETKLLEQSKMAAIGQMAAGIAHEIRNPLFGISAVAQILAKQAAHNEETQILANQMRAEIDRLKRLLDNLLLYSRPRKLERKAIDPKVLCQTILEFHTSTLQEKHVRVVSSFEPNEGKVFVDTEQMRQVLLNLCLNALQSSPEGGVIEVESQITPGDASTWTLRVRNQGEPIRSEHTQIIFDPFFSTRKEGSGLGLSVCRKIVEDHGGRLTLEESNPHSTVFSFTIPLQNA